MLFPVYIAKRYLVARKSHHIINIIAGISVGGITVGTMALVIVLSVFNGFEGLVTGLFNSFNPEFRITSIKGKTFHLAELPPEKIREIPGIVYVTPVVEENALARHGEKQFIVMMKGVGEEFNRMTPLDSFMLEGVNVLQSGSLDLAVIGAGVAYYLDIYPREFSVPISLYVPQRTRKTVAADAFNIRTVPVAGVFSIQQDFDMQYVILPVGLVRELLEYTDETTALELGLSPGASIGQVRKGLENLAGPSFEVKDRFQQQALLYKIMKTEKWAVFLILAFILVIAAFNMIGSLTMLIVDKKKDLSVLWSLGATKSTVKKIFYAEGMLMSITGGLIGLVLGTAISLLQQEFGLLSLGGGEGSYIVEAYPVRVQVLDLVYVFLTVILIGAATTWYPVRQISRRYLSQRLSFFLAR